MTNQLRTRVLWANETELSPGQGNQRTQHTFYHLYILRSGEEVLCYGDQRYFLKGGQCLLVPPRVLHETPKESHNLANLYEIKFEIYDQALDNMVRQIGPCFEMTPFVEGAAKYIIFHWARTGFLSQVNVDNMLSAMLLSICDSSNQEEWVSSYIDISNYDQRVTQIIRYIEENYNETVRLEHLAEAVGLNLRYMCRIFKKQTGHTIIEYLNYVRIRYCMNALYYCTNSAVDVYFNAGFSSLVHFNRIFKKYLGITPGVYRQFYSSGKYNPLEEGYALQLYEKNIEQKITTTMDEAFESLKAISSITKNDCKQQS